MLYVVLVNGAVEELPTAINTVRSNGKLVFTDSTGQELKRYRHSEVIMFSRHEWTLEHAKRADLQRR